MWPISAVRHRIAPYGGFPSNPRPAIRLILYKGERAASVAATGAKEGRGMKRTVLAAVVVAALVFGVIGYAVAADEAVVVTARVNPAFSMTISTNAIDYTGLAIGATANDTALIQVKSNKLWDFSKVDVVDPLLVPVLVESTDVAAGTGKAQGVTDITATYALDLTGDAAYDLAADTDYTATYTYTAVQQ